MSNGAFTADDLTAKARIRDAALHVIAAEGLRGATLRKIAERAGVSASLVQHHFRTKRGISSEVSSWVLSRLIEATNSAAPTDDAAETQRLRMEAFDDMLVGTPVIGDYIRRMLLEATPEGTEWFATWVRESALMMDYRQSQGLARPSADRLAEAAMVVTLSLAPLLLKPLLEAGLEEDFEQGKGRERWRRALAELLTTPLFLAPAPASAVDVEEGRVKRGRVAYFSRQRDT